MAVIGVVADLHHGDHHEEGEQNNAEADKHDISVEGSERGLTVGPGQ